MDPTKVSGQKIRRRVIIALAGIPVVMALSCCIALNVLCTHDVREAEYRGLEFSGSYGTYRMLSSFSPKECELFLEISGEGRFPIQAIPQDVLDRRFHKTSFGKNHIGYDTDYVPKGESQDLILKYKDGELVAFHGSPAFSRTRDGPYLKFPIAYEDLYKVWGKPDKVHRHRETERAVFH